MWLANIICVGMIQVWANANAVTLGKIWWALAVSIHCYSNNMIDIY